eukprot:TRINITY_DN4153_c0_g1_i2.p1 TRINITY_DN4153_c0_g1~~TRINITY_DN4153_c0_g1_i2.p1  ORF type:complete len:328 (-),score=42.30 TRINITY_DN4153_c0_g1_i2:33-1016(-)
MKLLSLCTFLSCVFSMRSELCDTNWKSCSNVADIATITCDTATRSDCDVVNGSLTTSDDESVLGLVVPPFTTIDPETCRKKCQEQADSAPDQKCEFFRWFKDHATKETTCSLQTTCEHDQWCDSFDCATGQLPDCDEDGNRIFPCPLASPTVWDNSKFHVICTDPLLGDVNVYDSMTTSVPGNTVCSTIRMCAAWNETGVEASEPFYRKLAIKCNGAVGSESGTWEALPLTGSAALSAAMIADNTIIEQECASTCDDLTITIPPNQYWADLICDNPLEENKLKDGNSCILLCDNHLKMSIDCRFTREGEKQWQDGEGTELTAATIKC